MTSPLPVPVDPRPRVPVWLGACVALLFILIATFAPMPGESYVPPAVTSVVLAVLAAAALPWRRRWPIIVLAVVVVLFAIAALTGLRSSGPAVAVAIATAGVTSRVERRAGFFISTGVLVVVVALTLIGTGGPTMDPTVVQYALAIIVGSAIGDASRSRRAYIAAMMERAERAEQSRESEARRRVSEERLRIARDLHDAVAHQIAVISLNAGVASANVDTRPEKAKESLATIRGAARTVLGEIGGLLDVLRGGDTATTAPQPGLAHLDAMTTQFADAGLDVTVRVEGDLSAVTGGVDLVAYRVVQEALTNAHKHGTEHRAHVLLSVTDDSLAIVVSNPVGARGDGAEPVGSGLGLIGLRERVAAARGTVETGPAPGGWRLVATIPLHQAAPADRTPSSQHALPETEEHAP